MAYYPIFSLALLFLVIIVLVSFCVGIIDKEKSLDVAQELLQKYFPMYEISKIKNVDGAPQVQLYDIISLTAEALVPITAA